MIKKAATLLGLLMSLFAVNAGSIRFLSMDNTPISALTITGVVGESTIFANFKIKNRTQKTLKFYQYNWTGFTVNPAGTGSGYCFPLGQTDTVVGVDGACTANFAMNIANITQAGTYHLTFTVTDEWGIKSVTLPVTLTMGAVQGDLTVTPETNLANTFNGVKRIIVQNSGDVVIPDVVIDASQTGNDFTVYDGGNASTAKGLWCTSTSCPDRCSSSTLAIGARCYVYVKANADVALGTPSTGTVVVRSNAAAENVSLTLTNTAVMYADGNFTDASGNWYVAKYNGSTWSNIGTGPSATPFNRVIRNIVTDARGDVYVAGNFDDGSHRYVAKYSAGVWNNIGSGPTGELFNDYVRALVFDRNGNLYAAGHFADSSGNQYVAKYNGSTWTNIGSGPSGGFFNNLIYALEVDSSGNLYAGGRFTDGSGNQYVAKYNGSTWTNIGSGPAVTPFNDTIFSEGIYHSDNLYAGGRFTDGSGNQYVAKYNGSTWINIGSGPSGGFFNNLVYALEVDSSDNLYAGGYFTDSSGNQYVAKYNGSTWTNIGSGPSGNLFNNHIFVLLVDSSGNLYVAGNFTDGSGNQYVAKYNGSTWTNIGSGPAGELFNNYVAPGGLVIDNQLTISL